jgi:hypothetical protein
MGRNISDCGFGNTQRTWLARLKKNPGGKNIKSVLPFWLLLLELLGF